MQAKSLIRIGNGEKVKPTGHVNEMQHRTSGATGVRS
jgi:hypothetical protein